MTTETSQITVKNAFAAFLPINRAFDPMIQFFMTLLLRNSSTKKVCIFQSVTLVEPFTMV